MNKLVKFFVMLVLFSIVASLVFVAGDFAMSGSPLIALIPVSVILIAVVAYIQYNDKRK
jgi:hypothetical protein